ncbi:uncharacterized protein LOC113460944 [Phoenix dactylifera]|uniref:Uncharacterized protein LOC113460944 n=1 Tax=Phoenix dactylifera TaxID=42345 RepID=A0A8B8ZGJ5_PHODC|nr:uncharacterized protein LOC113460944 [Phoenix dactylifera]
MVYVFIFIEKGLKERAMEVHNSMSHGLVALLLVMICLSCIMARVWATIEQFEVQQHLIRLDKPVKSIKSPDGDIIDCVHISHQPAFDHPLLKNHTIQMRPSFHPLGRYDENREASKMETSSIPQLWHQNRRCPKDTIPIRRTKKGDVLRSSFIERYGKKRHRTIPNPTSIEPNWNSIGHEHAIAYVTGDKYHGAKATINVWNPKLENKDEFSLSQLWILGGPAEVLNTIEAGWHVYPMLNGDHRTRLFTFWTGDGYKSGCYNLRCSGFVQVNKEVALGATIYPISSYGGRQYEITLSLWKDPKTGNWWLQYGNQSPVGYWPSSLFPHLSDSGSVIQWGGEVVNLYSKGQHTSTEMGSGHFPEEGFGKASFFKNIRIVDKSDQLQAPRGVRTFATQANCYNVHHKNNGYFYYGGPGLNPNCTT